MSNAIIEWQYVTTSALAYGNQQGLHMAAFKRSEGFTKRRKVYILGLISTDEGKTYGPGAGSVNKNEGG